MLYSNDIKECNFYAQRSPENLNRCAVFVLATIQQQLETVPVAFNDMLNLGAGSKFAWSHKGRGIAYLNANINQVYKDAIQWRDEPVRLLEIFLQIPGMALIKAGFLCQIFAGEVGCIDLHNVKLYGIKRSDTRYEPAKPATLRRKRENYVALCQGLGGAHVLWSAWCDYVAELRPQNWNSGAEVSAFHFAVISGRETGVSGQFELLDYEPAFRQGDDGPNEEYSQL